MLALGVVTLLIRLYRLCPIWHTRSMKTAMPANSDKNYRFPAEIISQAVWLSFRSWQDITSPPTAAYWS
jgi:hypothetical protein